LTWLVIMKSYIYTANRHNIEKNKKETVQLLTARRQRRILCCLWWAAAPSSRRSCLDRSSLRTPCTRSSCWSAVRGRCVPRTRLPWSVSLSADWSWELRWRTDATAATPAWSCRNPLPSSPKITCTRTQLHLRIRTIITITITTIRLGLTALTTIETIYLTTVQLSCHSFFRL